MRQLWRALILAVFVLVVSGQALVGQESPSRSIINLVAWPRAHDAPIVHGTAFFIGRDGTALTNSHVVENVRAHPREYDLLAIWRGEFYGATLVCASGSRKLGQPLIRDVAEVRLTAPHFGADTLTFNRMPYAHAHRGPLPEFPALQLGVDPEVDQPVRVLGFGYRKDTPLPYEWSAVGTVTRWLTLSDGTPAFDIEFAGDAESGHSGSPVIDARNEVVGIFTWHDTHEGRAQGRAAFDPPCR